MQTSYISQEPFTRLLEEYQLLGIIFLFYWFLALSCLIIIIGVE